MKKLKLLSLFLIGIKVMQTKDNWNAKQYANNSNLQEIKALKFLNNFTFKDNETILDIGSGDGKITAQLANNLKKSEVFAIDKSENMINFAKKQYNQPNLKFEQKDVLNLDVNNFFDFVFSFFCVHWVENQQKVAKNIFNALKNGGLCGIINGISAEFPYEKAFFKLKNKPQWNSFFKNYKPSYYLHSQEIFESFFTNIGFKIVSSEVKDDILYLKDQSEFEKFVRSIPHFNSIPENLYEDFIKDFVNEYLDISPQTQQGVPIFTKNIFLILQKP